MAMAVKGEKGGRVGTLHTTIVVATNPPSPPSLSLHTIVASLINVYTHSLAHSIYYTFTEG